MAPRKATINIDLLKEDVYVRTALNEDHALMLATLYEAGAALPPIDVTADHRIVDGRHRKHALKFILERKSCEVNYVNETENADIIFRAMRSNAGGALPPSKSDINYTIRQLLELGVPTARIVSELPFPPSLVRNYIKGVRAMMGRDKVLAAARAVQEGHVTIATAAAEHGADEASVRELLSNNRKNKNTLNDLKGKLTSNYRGRSRALANVYSRMMTAYENGDISFAKVENVFAHAQNLHRQAHATMVGWQNRFDKMKDMLDKQR